MIKASEFCKRVFDGTHDTPKPVSNGYKLLTSKHIMNNYLDTDSAYYISEEDYNEINKRSQVQKWDVLFSMIGSVGAVYLVTEDKIDFAIKNMGVFSCEEEYRAKWLFFYLQSPYAQNIIRNYLNGAVQKFIPLGMLRDFPIPEMEKKDKKVVDLLWEINQKMINNDAICSELEEMAKTIYDYWFLQFEFPNEEGKPYKSSGGKMVWNEELKREIPEKWKSGYLDEMIEICNGKDHQNLEVGEIPVYGSGGILRYVNKNLYHGESVLIPRKGTLNNVIYVDEPFWTVDTMFYTKMKKKDSALFVYYTVKLFDFEKLNTGTGVPSMTSSIIYSLKTIIPDENILEAFNSKVCPLYKQIQHNKKENQELTSLRDFLLPLLMNGQVSFKE